MSIKMRATHTKIKNQANCVFNCNGSATRRLLLTSVIGLLLSAAQAYSVDELLPPFGFRWNDSMAHVEAVLHGAKAKIISRDKKENRDVWTVEGLLHPGLKRTLFTFKQRALVAVELQYEYPDRSIEWYNQRMGEIRKYFDEKYGTGKLVSRSRDTDTEVIQTLVGYQWMVGATMLELFYFSAQRGQLLYRTITVDYKAM
jgi:nuclear transport factor 2 (NTF2) superfamily protein